MAKSYYFAIFNREQDEMLSVDLWVREVYKSNERHRITHFARPANACRILADVDLESCFLQFVIGDESSIRHGVAELDPLVVYPNDILANSALDPVRPEDNICLMRTAVLEVYD